MTSTGASLPTYYVSHGGGPWPWMEDQMPFDMSTLRESLASIPTELPVTPKAVLVVSAHWETPQFTVQTNPNPPMLYDYGGFPEFTYHIEYPAPGSPEVAARVAELLEGSGITVHTNPDRGFDHGMFAPMYVMWPDADVPMLQLSILRNFDPAAHFEVGRALAPLRDEGVLIVGSGLSWHNLAMFGPQAKEPSAEFDRWLSAALLDSTGARRTNAVQAWEQAPSARVAHPREDHLIPLMVALGAAEDDAATRVYHETKMAGGITASSFRFG